MSIRQTLKKIPLFVIIYQWWVGSKPFFRFRIFLFIKSAFGFWYDYFSYKKLERNPNFTCTVGEVYPSLIDKITNTPIEPIYFYQDSWGARKIFDLNPSRHYDIGSSVKLVSILAQKLPVIMVDIRPVAYPLEGLSFLEGSIVNLPFESNSLETISSLCVVEHIGLGRYGDPLDSWGSEKAIKELIRVIKNNGHIIFSVPVDSTSKVQFNAQRVFTKEYILKQFQECDLVEDKYIYGNELLPSYFPGKGFGVGLFLFRKK